MAVRPSGLRVNPQNKPETLSPDAMARRVWQEPDQGTQGRTHRKRFFTLASKRREDDPRRRKWRRVQPRVLSDAQPQVSFGGLQYFARMQGKRQIAEGGCCLRGNGMPRHDLWRVWSGPRWTLVQDTPEWQDQLPHFSTAYISSCMQGLPVPCSHPVHVSRPARTATLCMLILVVLAISSTLTSCRRSAQAEMTRTSLSHRTHVWCAQLGFPPSMWQFSLA